MRPNRATTVMTGKTARIHTNPSRDAPLASVAGLRVRCSAQPFNIGNQIVDLGAGQPEIGHGAMRMRQEGTQLTRIEMSGGYPKTRWSLGKCRGRPAAIDDVAIGAPLPRE